MPSLRLVPYGPPAVSALRDAIVEAKGDDPLAPVTVAVPSNYAGLSLRRILGRGDLSLTSSPGASSPGASPAGRAREGLVNVRFLVLARVAELLGAPALAAKGLRPLTGPVRAEAVRAALAHEPGIFRDTASHAATERSLESTFRDLRQAPQQALDAVARQSERAAHVVRLYRDVRARTTAYYDEEQLALAAAEALRHDRQGPGSPALRDVGHVVLYLPRRLSPAERAFVAALAAAGAGGGLSVIIGLTGDPDADRPARRLASGLEPALGPAQEAPAQPAPVGSRIVAVTDAEEEVRSVLRQLMERLAGGAPLHRMAVLYPTVQPYALLAHEQFEAAGVPHNGPAVRTLAQTLSGRTLLGLLHLREADFRRDALMDWLSGAPVLERPGGRPAPAHRWDALARSAGVVGGAGQWRERLARFRRSLAVQRDTLVAREDGDGGGEWRLRRLEADLNHAERLDRFIDHLTRQVQPGARSSWAEFARWARDLLASYLGGEGDWPDEEIEAHRAVEAALEGLSNLDDVRPQTDEATFRRALERELEAPAGRIGHFGDGVFIGRVRDALGTDFDIVFLLGMSEGVMPPRGRDDPLLPDDERSVAGEELPLRAARPAEERRDYLAALAGGRERVLLFPRADLRGQRGRLPARWLLDTASQLEGRTIFSTDLEQLPARPWFTVVPSFEGALADNREPASEQEYDLRSLLNWRRTGASVVEHYLVTRTRALHAGLSADLSRRGAGLTRWDGRVDVPPELAPSADRPVSPTALQHWAECPFRYLLGHVLRIAETERPEDTLTISPLERGNLLHRALETFIREAPKRQTPDQPWSADERARLREIGERLCDEFESAGLTGRPLLWRLERDQILRDLDSFLDADEALRAEHGVVPEAVELAFGVPDADQPAIIVPLADGRSIAFRGRIDRVDRAPDGSRLLVLDYKSGSPGPYTKLKIDVVQRGKLLQLPVYALAAQQRFGERPAEGYYWFIREQWNYQRHGYSMTDEALASFRDALTVIVGGIGQGLFPARPGAATNTGFENCRICPYDRVCPSDRARAWGRKREAPELQTYRHLAEPED